MTFKNDKQRKAVMAKLRTIDALPFRRNRLPVQVSVLVPSTKIDTPISKKEFDNRVNSEQRWFNKNYGGSTKSENVGTFNLGKKLIKEPVVAVESSMTVKKYNETRDKLTKHFIAQRKKWKQNSILVKVEGQVFIVPKQDFIDDDKGQGKKIIVT